MNEEDKKIAGIVEKTLPEISQSIDIIVDAFKNSGRLFYLGCGTSGRLGVLDASECPPTYGVSPDLVVGIIAGGDRCLRSAAENSEDIFENGIKDLKERNLKQNDVVVGISVSGDAPYLMGALGYAKELGCKVIALSCNKDCKIGTIADITIITDTGAEVVTGSTRLKAGTATKMVLNMLTTASMVKMGYTISNLMVNVKPTNVKLLDRCARICVELTGIDYILAVEKIKSGQTIREIYKEFKSELSN